MHPMELLCNVGPVESHFSLFGDSVSVGARLVHGLRRTYHVAQVDDRFSLFGDSANLDAR
jgi:hypothetical protein